MLPESDIMTAAPGLAGDLELAAPAPLRFRYEQFDAGTGCEPHHHRWGQLNRINLGLMEIGFGETNLIAPADYIIWVPAGRPHAAYIRQALAYTSAYVDAQWGGRLPDAPCLIEQTPLIRALFDDFCRRGVRATDTAAEQLQAQLLLQRVLEARRLDAYLPDSRQRPLLPILEALRADPGDMTPLARWAERVHSTERTLARHFQRELGMSFLQWRTRLRLLRAQSALRQGQSVQAIAGQLGYATTSAFIAMFRQHTGLSPQRYRREQESAA
jgi:AraC-like DNA-binding protein